MAMDIKVVEESFVSPPPGSVPTTCVPLTFIDIYGLGYPARQRLIFYEFPHPTPYFIQTTLPNLKASLSRTLQHFYPLAAKVVVPPHPQLPHFRYSEDDSVQFIACESAADFNHLTSNHDARCVQELKALVPELPRPVLTISGCSERPVMAVQVTLFPMVGISIGIGFCHSVADGRSLAHFLKSWSYLHRCDCDQLGELPNFDRDLIKDPFGLASIFTEEKRQFMERIPTTPKPIDDTKLQATFFINRSQVESLKHWLTKKWINEENQSDSEPIRMSTFVATCAYMWVCLVKSQPHSFVGDDDDELRYFHFSADIREHLKVPTTYFGNCTDFRLTSAKKSELLGVNGVVVAAKAIAREIMGLEQGLLKEAAKWSSRQGALVKAGSQIVATVASLNFGLYNNTDFGWGRPRKTESVNLGYLAGSIYSVSINENRSEEEGGVEFVLGFDANHDINGFNAIFSQGLLNLQ